ncbi:hypothetical protein [Palaeococcus ferrophilus]|uniref:hypothetical protein n=1 Tax=Palaeococcus ferrophilus TaxID=83868 RepID=UPI00064E53D4|nr:hypothetical protein [Palaeococcus ferrophilus]
MRWKVYFQYDAGDYIAKGWFAPRAERAEEAVERVKRKLREEFGIEKPLITKVRPVGGRS